MKTFDEFYEGRLENKLAIGNRVLSNMGKIKLDKGFVDLVKSDIHDLYDVIGLDIEQAANDLGVKWNKTDVIDTLLDQINHHVMRNGHPYPAKDILANAYKDHGYDTVFKFLAKNIKL